MTLKLPGSRCSETCFDNKNDSYLDICLGFCDEFTKNTMKELIVIKAYMKIRINK